MNQPDDLSNIVLLSVGISPGGMTSLAPARKIKLHVKIHIILR